jgi:hypothetical protein
MQLMESKDINLLIQIVLVIFRNKLIFYGEELLARRPTPQLEDPLVFCWRLLIQYIRSQKERDHWEVQDVGGWTILKWILER